VNTVVVAGFVAWRGITPRLDWLLIVPLLLELYLVVVGVSLILATVFVFLRDIGQVWELALQLLFYASPVIYPIGFLPPWARDLAFLNPLTQILQDLRALVLYPDLPSNKITAADALSTGRLLPIAIAVGILVGGLLLFRRYEPKFAERV
jgi:ABC-2 type transport system permease protein